MGVYNPPSVKMVYAETINEAVALVTMEATVLGILESDCESVYTMSNALWRAGLPHFRTPHPIHPRLFLSVWTWEICREKEIQVNVRLHYLSNEGYMSGILDPILDKERALDKEKGREWERVSGG